MDYRFINDNSTVSIGNYTDILKPPDQIKYTIPKPSISKIPDNECKSFNRIFSFPNIQLNEDEEKITAADIFDKPQTDICEYYDNEDCDLDAEIEFLLNM